MKAKHLYKILCKSLRQIKKRGAQTLPICITAGDYCDNISEISEIRAMTRVDDYLILMSLEAAASYAGEDIVEMSDVSALLSSLQTIYQICHLPNLEVIAVDDVDTIRQIQTRKKPLEFGNSDSISNLSVCNVQFQRAPRHSTNKLQVVLYRICNVSEVREMEEQCSEHIAETLASISNHQNYHNNSDVLTSLSNIISDAMITLKRIVKEQN